MDKGELREREVESRDSPASLITYKMCVNVFSKDLMKR